MKGYFAALSLLLLLGAAGAASATTTAVLDFNNTKNSANLSLITNGPNGAVTMSSVGGRNAVMTTGTSAGEYLYVALPKGLFKGAKDVWATVEYYDQGSDAMGTGQFQLHYDVNGTDMPSGQSNIHQFQTKMWVSHSWNLSGADFEEAGPGGADIWIDDMADGNPVAIDKIIVSDTDPNTIHWPHVDKNHPVTIDGKIDPGEWDNARALTVNAPWQDAVHAANWGGPQDFSGTYYFMWDENGVYVRGDVTDMMPRLNDGGGSTAYYYKGDGFQLYLGLDWSDPGHSDYLDTDHNVYVGLGDGKNGSLPPSWEDEWGSSHTIVDWSQQGTVPIPAANLAITNTTSPKGYQFEFFLPWQMMLKDDGSMAKIAAGQTIGFFFFANNSTTIGPSGQQVAMEPFGLTNSYGHAYNFTAVVLDPPAAGQ